MINLSLGERTKPFSRRNFLAGTSCFGAAYALARLIPTPVLAASLAADARVAQSPLVDKGFAAVRKIGDGLYATISDGSKGAQTMSNGGFLAGKDGALLLEGYASTTGAAFQLEALRMVSQAPVRAALNTHYHFDHSLGNAFYGGQNIPLWGHAQAANRIAGSYIPLQGADRAAVLAPLEKRVKDAKSDTERQHAQGDVNTMGSVFDLLQNAVLAVPNHPLDPAKLPMTVDLGGVQAVLESFPGHSGTDIIVRVPEQDVVYTGDLLFHGMYPVCFDEKATVSGWRATLKTFASYSKETLFVPGHGQICGQEGIQQLRDVFDDIAGQAEKLYQAGVAVEAAAHRYTPPEKFKNLGIFAWGFTIGPAISKLYEEWQGKKA